MNRIGQKLLTIIMGGMLVISMFFVGKEAARYTWGNNVQSEQPCVVIDAGHGGTCNRPKELNLQINQITGGIFMYKIVVMDYNAPAFITSCVSYYADDIEEFQRQSFKSAN